MKRKLAISALLAGVMLLSGCASKVDLRQFISAKLTPATLNTSPYKLQAMLPPSGTYKHMRVYLEGDGHAWATGSQPSTDPTPHSSVMLKYASEDQGPAVYLARPCQFVMSSACNVGVWTGSRFSRAPTDVMNAGLDVLKSRFRVESFELVGHSGGGNVALVVAAMRSDVVQVQTIAGNLDPALWTQLHDLSPLIDPLMALQFRDKLAALPQRHIVGLKDTIVPPAIAYEYAKRLHGTCLEIASTTATHSTGFDDAWHYYAAKPITCKLQ